MNENKSEESMIIYNENISNWEQARLRLKILRN